MTPLAAVAAPLVIKYYDFERRLKSGREIQRLFPANSLNRLCSTPISVYGWGRLAEVIPDRRFVSLFAALESYVGPIAGDRTFSRRMTAAQHTIWLLDSLERLALCADEEAARSIYCERGLGGLANSSAQLVCLNRAYQGLSNQDKRVLWLATILHDIGKATGRRERHPLVGAEKLRESHLILPRVRQILSSSHTSTEVVAAERIIVAVVGQHDLVGGLAIIKDKNIFDCGELLRQLGADPSERQRVLTMLALVNFADIDGQSEQGIFNNNKLAAFVGTYFDLMSIIGSADAKKDFAWWGEERIKAWIVGDSPPIQQAELQAAVDAAFSDSAGRAEFFATIGQLRSFDVIYNFGTALHDPGSMVKFLSWIAQTVRRQGIDSVTMEVQFLTDQDYSRRVKEAAAGRGTFDDYFGQDIASNNGVKTLMITKKIYI